MGWLAATSSSSFGSRYGFLMDENKFSIKGEIRRICEKKVISEKFELQEFDLETDLHTPYPQVVRFRVANKNLSLLDGLSVGADVNVHFNLRGRETERDGEARVWNALDAWRIERGVEVPKAAPSQAADDPPF